MAEKYWFYTFSAELSGPSVKLVFMQGVFSGAFVGLVMSLQAEEYYHNKALVSWEPISRTTYEYLHDNMP